MKYGISYKGSKNKLAENILNLFPKKDNLYDLFAGGGAITHCALLQNKFKRVYMNDINWQPIKLFVDAAKGLYRNEARWISRSDFFEQKENDPFISICWSFGNNTRDYLYAQDLEENKHAWHNAIFYNNFDDAKRLLKVDFSPIAAEQDRVKKYYLSKKILKENRVTCVDQLQHIQNLERLESLERLTQLQTLETLERLERLERLETSVTSYSNVTIKENSIIYCDIPYENTNSYGSNKDNLGFNFKEFYDWAEAQKELCFISSYELPAARFECIAEFKHRATLAATTNNEVTERVFIPKAQIKQYKALQPQPSLFDDFW